MICVAVWLASRRDEQHAERNILGQDFPVTRNWSVSGMAAIPFSVDPGTSSSRSRPEASMLAVTAPVAGSMSMIRLVKSTLAYTAPPTHSNSFSPVTE